MDRKRTRFESQVIRQRKRTTLIGGIVVVAILGLSYLFVWERVYTLRLAEENSRTHQRVRNLTERAKTLEYDINQLCSVKRIEDIARRDLALIPQRDFQLASFSMSVGSNSSAPADSLKLAQKEKAKEATKKQKPTKNTKTDKPKTTKSKTDGKITTKKPGTRK